ncbi:MAG: hypothetical protein AABZ47_10005 [Planctomycetota bacterium]
MIQTMEGDNPGPGEKPTGHSKGFRSVRWNGTNYSFTATQAAIVKQLWEPWENGTPDEPGDTLLATAEVADSQRIRDVFKNHPAWTTMIVQGETKGTYRLSPPKN